MNHKRMDDARKRDPYKSYGKKLLSLFARLLFSDESHSLTELVQMFDCSKQTILRLIDNIRKVYCIDVGETEQKQELLSNH